jgi:hypothetical protein
VSKDRSGCCFWRRSPRSAAPSPRASTGSGSSGSTSRSGWRRSRSPSSASRRASAATPRSTSAASLWSPAARSASSGVSSAATQPGGVAPRWWPHSQSARRCWPHLWPGSCGQPMLPMCFRSRAFSSGNAGVFFLFASLFGAVFFLAQFLQTGLGYGPLDAARSGGPDRRAAASGRLRPRDRRFRSALGRWRDRRTWPTRARPGDRGRGARPGRRGQGRSLKRMSTSTSN